MWHSVNARYYNRAETQSIETKGGASDAPLTTTRSTELISKTHTSIYAGKRIPAYMPSLAGSTCLPLVYIPRPPSPLAVMPDHAKAAISPRSHAKRQQKDTYLDHSRAAQSPAQRPRVMPPLKATSSANELRQRNVRAGSVSGVAPTTLAR